MPENPIVREPDGADHSEGDDEGRPAGRFKNVGRICRDIEPGGEERQAETEDEIAESLEPLGKAFAINRRSGAGLIARNVRCHVSAITQRAHYSGGKTIACRCPEGHWRYSPPDQKKELVSRLERLTNSKLTSTQPQAAANRPYGVAEGDGEGEVLLSFFVVSVDDFLVVVEDFFMSSFFMCLFGRGLLRCRRSFSRGRGGCFSLAGVAGGKKSRGGEGESEQEELGVFHGAA